MTISSQTPEGDPNQCPVCGQECRLEPTRFSGDAPCPNCGHLLWFLDLPDAAIEKLRTILTQVLISKFGPVPIRDREVIWEADADDLNGWFERSLTASNLDEVLNRPQPKNVELIQTDDFHKLWPGLSLLICVLFTFAFWPKDQSPDHLLVGLMLLGSFAVLIIGYFHCRKTKKRAAS